MGEHISCADSAGLELFIASLLLEEGLAHNTLQTYHCDLHTYASFLTARQQLDGASSAGVRAWLEQRHSLGSKATSGQETQHWMQQDARPAILAG